ncbi:hypothetical protein MPSEU_000312700 [Mayamaea pseudoterrestris]|nr:hypothetical protein MPSEU_000312700 [Mayamaea pseudoterrestris]
MMKCLSFSTSLAAVALLLVASCFVEGLHAQQLDAEAHHAMEQKHEHRSLGDSSWSFANMMYHLHACPPPAHCPGGPIVSPLHPCGCPDCSKPHPNDPAFAHGYCYVASSSSESSYEEATSSYNSTESLQEEETAQNGAASNSSANWMFSPLYYVIGGAVLAVGAAAVIMRQRNNKTSNELLLDDDEHDGSNNNNMLSSLSRRVGLLAAAGTAGVAAAIGFAGRRNKHYRSDASLGDLSGSVGRRMRSVETGGDASSPYYCREEEVPPMFVNVPDKGTYSPDPTLVEHPESVEVEGPYRPSSYYSACV